MINIGLRSNKYNVKRNLVALLSHNFLILYLYKAQFAKVGNIIIRVRRNGRID